MTEPRHAHRFRTHVETRMQPHAPAILGCIRQISKSWMGINCDGVRIPAETSVFAPSSRTCAHRGHAAARPATMSRSSSPDVTRKCWCSVHRQPPPAKGRMRQRAVCRVTTDHHGQAVANSDMVAVSGSVNLDLLVTTRAMLATRIWQTNGRPVKPWSARSCRLVVGQKTLHASRQNQRARAPRQGLCYVRAGARH